MVLACLPLLGPPSRYDAVAVQSGLAELRDDLERWAAQHGPSRVPGFGLAWQPGIAVFLIGMVLGYAFVFVLLAGLAVIAICLVLGRWHNNLAVRYRDDLHAQLVSGGLLERLALEGLPKERAVDYIPMPFRLLFPVLASRKVTLSSEMNMVGTQLDWYLKPPAKLLRPEWVGTVVQIVTFPVLIICLYVNDTNVIANAPGASSTQLTMIYILMIITTNIGLLTYFEEKRSKLSLGVLAHELLQRL